MTVTERPDTEGTCEPIRNAPPSPIHLLRPGEDYLFSAMRISPAEAIAAIFAVCFPDAVTALDATWGKGNFWAPDPRDRPVRVIGMDRDPRRARDVVGDFTALPFRDEAVCVAVGDPPFLSDGGRSSIMRRQYTADLSLADSKASVTRLCRELWRVSRLGIVIKVQDGIHANRLIRMTRWAEDALSMPIYEELLVPNEHSKVIDPRWKRPQLSFYRNHSAYLVFRKDGPIHKRRRPALRPAPPEPPRVCRVCNDPLVGRRPTASTCSGACRQMAYRQRRAMSGGESREPVTMDAQEHT